jgi:hypothetical protein
MGLLGFVLFPDLCGLVLHYIISHEVPRPTDIETPVPVKISEMKLHPRKTSLTSTRQHGITSQKIVLPSL